MCDAVALTRDDIGELEAFDNNSEKVKQYIVACTTLHHKVLTTPSQMSFVSLSHLLNARISLRIRLRLAMVLSSATLQLYGTEWQNEYWSTKDVKFPVMSGQIWIGRPVFSRSLLPVQTSTQARLDSSSMELSGHVSNYTLLSLAIALTELGLGEPLGSYRHLIKARMADEHEAAYIVAELSRKGGELSDMVGEHYAFAVERCVKGNFNINENSLANDVLTAAVHEHVVQVLNDHVEHSHSVLRKGEHIYSLRGSVDCPITLILR